MVLKPMKCKKDPSFNYRVILIQVNKELYDRVKEETVRRNITLRKLVTRAIVSYLKSLET